LIYEAADFTFKPPAVISRARRVLIKPCASYTTPYPVTTSREMLSLIISGIRQISDADILILEGTPDGKPMYPVYKALGYNFPRVITLDVKDCTWVEVENPLPKPLVIPTFWVPNVILSSDYLITVAPLKIINGQSQLSIMNLLSLLPSSKYRSKKGYGWDNLYKLGIDKVITDLYFTLPFDLGIVEAKQKLIGPEPTQGNMEDCGKVFIDEPYKLDCEVVETLRLKAEHLNMIKEARVEFEI